ncbi:ATP-binding SpoIIE family protein phosphatase [Kineococcus arenarius]|uniref:ATP-binding SpoIIE family protein phosphatase n=1 Tax=unclassified Kineococcus TaxID=2621656 RepID=UPI003D7DCDB9
MTEHPGRSAREAWERSPSALLTLRPDGTVLDANRTLLDWAGLQREDVVGSRTLSGLLTVGGRIFWETHLAPLLLVERRLDEVAVEVRTPRGRLPVLMSAVLTTVGDGPAEVVHVALSSAGDRSRYERELVAARREAERSEARLRALQAVTAALSRAVGVDGVADALLRTAVAPLGASAGTVWLTGDDGGLSPRRSTGAVVELRPPPFGEVVHGEPVLVGEDLLVPLRGQTALHGVLALTLDRAAGAEPPSVDVHTAVGQQAGLALDRAHRYEERAGIAEQLQRSLLAGEHPHDERFTFATVYRPGVEALEVGGDWFDVFTTGEDVVSVVVGDVVGRGLGAAVAMGQLRSAVRAVADPGTGPAQVLSRLDRFVDQVEAARTATLVHAQLDLGDGCVRYACAGHLPPLLLPAQGAPRYLWGGRSTPLGVVLGARDRSEDTVQLGPGDRLLLYTDGLVERREQGLDEGLDVLLSTVAPLHGLGAQEVVESLTGALLDDGNARDDVCVLLLSWSGPVLERRVAADLTGLSPLRRELGAWLAERGAEEETAEDLVLAASEAVANAVEHGCGGRPEQHVTVRAELTRAAGPVRDPVVLITVADPGRWRARTASDERGRGLGIMRAVVDEVRVEPSDTGTRLVLRHALRGGAA